MVIAHWFCHRFKHDHGTGKKGKESATSCERRKTKFRLKIGQVYTEPDGTVHEILKPKLVCVRKGKRRRRTWVPAYLVRIKTARLGGDGVRQAIHYESQMGDGWV